MNRPFPQRKRQRLSGYDYSRAGAYFVTVCTQHRTHLFGRVVDGNMVLNPAGHMVWDVWHEIPVKFPTVLSDAFTVMPNHIHGVLWLTEPERAGGDAPNDRADETLPKAYSPSLPEIMQWFKSLTTARYRHGVVEQGWPPFPGKLWQRSYYDHIIRRDEALNRIRQYIHDNPKRWSMDRYNPEPVGPDPWAAEIWRMLQET